MRYLEEADELARRLEVAPRERARIALSLAEALWGIGGDRRHIHALAIRAREVFAKAQPPDRRGMMAAQRLVEGLRNGD